MMRIGVFQFSPGLWPTIAVLVVLPLLIGLGNWQLERADWKQDVVDAATAAAGQAPRDLKDVIDTDAERSFQPVYFSGRYDLARQLLLDNRIHDGRAGYHVLTPVLLEGYEEAVLVNRGWLPVGMSRAELPALPGPEQVRIISGKLARLPEKVFRLADTEESSSGWPQVIQQVDFEDIERRLGYRILPVVVQLEEQDPHGFTRDWKPLYGISPDKHRAYAMQWFTLALVLVLIYVGVNTQRTGKQG